MKLLAIILMVLGVSIWGLNLAIKLMPSNLPKTISGTSPASSNSAALGNTMAVTQPPAESAKIAVQILPTATPAESAATNSPSAQALPETLNIPKIGLLAHIESVGLDSARRMDVPKDWQNVGWYNLGYKIGEEGSAVIDGHFDTVSGAPAAFYRLSNLNPGDQITVIDSAGKSYLFKVTKKESYPWNNLPLPTIFATKGTAGLNLITCGGTWDRASHNYTQRTVIYSILQ